MVNRRQPLVRRGGKSTPHRVEKRMIIDMLNARRELKYIEVSSESNMPVDGGILPITQKIIQGDTSGTRDGDGINVSKLSLRLQLALNSAATLDFCRVIVFSDNQANGVYPTPSGSTNGILTAADPNAAYDFPVAVRKRFKILLDKDFAMSTAGNSKVVQFDTKLQLGNHRVYYSGTTDAEASNSKGAIYVMLISDTGTTLTAYNMTMAVWYYDS